MSDVDEIKRRLNIVDVVQDYTKLQKAGANFRGRCPFHTEKTPSFFVSPEKQIWHCFGSCARGGDVFRFIMEAEGIEFRQALELLAKRAGVPLERFDSQKQDAKTVLYHINETAADFFQKALSKTKGGELTLTYLKKRGVNEESQELFGLGYAPSSWHTLGTFLEKKGFQKRDVIAAGLAVQHEGGRIYDRFRARLMFPIYSINGQVVGFSGRILTDKEKEAKYINTPQTQIYDKSRELYGFYQAKSSLKEKGEAIVMEGNIDVIMSHQAGVRNAVATCGTALTPLHLSLLSRYTKKILLSFDNDEAGKKASFRAFELAQAQGFTLYALSLDGGKDPADIVLQDGGKSWNEQVEKKIHFIEYIWNVLSIRYSLDDIESKKELVHSFFGFLRLIPNTIERSHWLTEFAARLAIRDNDMFEAFQKFEVMDKNDFNKYNLSTLDRDRAKPAPLKRDRIFQDKENLMALYLSYPALCEEIIAAGAGLTGDIINSMQEEMLTYITKDELALKAQTFWPSAYLAKKELLRIVNDFNISEKKLGAKKAMTL